MLAHWQDLYGNHANLALYTQARSNRDTNKSDPITRHEERLADLQLHRKGCRVVSFCFIA